MVLKWENPPAPKRLPGTNQALYDELKANPNRWALVKNNAKNGGESTSFKKKGFKSVSRANGDGTFRIYAMWEEK